MKKKKKNPRYHNPPPPGRRRRMAEERRRCLGPWTRESGRGRLEWSERESSNDGGSDCMKERERESEKGEREGRN